jgi:hypothetical protein
MSELTEFSIPYELKLGGKIVLSGLFFPKAIESVTADVPTATSDVSQIIYKSYPLTVDQAQTLLKSIDADTISFLRAVCDNNGSASFALMMRIFGIVKWTEFSSRHGRGLTRAVRHITGDPNARLVWWLDDEWATDNDPDGEVYIDGPALQALKKATSPT